MLVFRAEIHKTLVSMVNREDPDQTASKKQSDLGLCCLSRPFGQATSGRNFRASSVLVYIPCLPLWEPEY